MDNIRFKKKKLLFIVLFFIMLMDVSFLKDLVENKPEEPTVENLLKNLKSPDTKRKKVKLSELKPSDFADKPEIRNKYFRVDNRDTEMFHLPDISPEEYEKMAEFMNPKNPANLKKESATDYFKKKARVESAARDLGLSASKVDTKDYIWNELYYMRSNLLDAMYFVDEFYREQEEDVRYWDPTKCYIAQDPCKVPLDSDLWENLWKLCIKAIYNQQVMLLGKVDKCINYLLTVLEYSEGFHRNISAPMSASLRSYYNYFEELLTDEKMQDFLKENSDLTVFANDELTTLDYIQTYSKILKILNAGDPDIEYFEFMLAKTPYAKNIIAYARPDKCDAPFADDPIKPRRA